MKNLCFCFQIHAPFQLKRYRFFEIGHDHYYYDDFQTVEQITRLVNQSYLPTNRAIADMINNSNRKFKCAFAISGVALEQLEQYAPELIDSFKELAQTGCVEFLAQPYANSLASVYDANEFELQLKLHAEKIAALFGQKTTALFNSELIYSDEIAAKVAEMGYKTMLVPAAKQIMGWKSPNYVYHSGVSSKLKLLVRNAKLSDDISFRFSDHSWSDFPLDAEKFIHWVNATPAEEGIVNLWMGYETFGLRQNIHSGIFDFLKAIPFFALQHQVEFATPSEATKKIASVGAIVASHPISWIGESKDISFLNGNDLQQEALGKLYAVAERVRLCSDKALKRDWQILQSTDHFRYMNHIDATGTYYESAYEAFMNYMNILADFLQRVNEQYPTTIDNEELNELLKTINHQEREIESLEKEIQALKNKGSRAKKTQ